MLKPRQIDSSSLYEKNQKSEKRKKTKKKHLKDEIPFNIFNEERRKEIEDPDNEYFHIGPDPNPSSVDFD
jgi:hypothetical protein